ncbi:hypothetical protein [Photobacterium sanguinicancri]|uniref:hypothetical protein n=1 Tax=Photobacterium sanguinicancri TaxID=875932 RepID=UPI0026E12C63|nr:hypothetical protein [Photobacterium sanguinicancri]MDO6497331.1 hypothetical protein [Photobacterium sanguinicancri]
MSEVLARRSGIKRAYPMSPSQTLKATTCVFLLNGLAIDYQGATGAGVFAGIATFEVDNSTGAAGSEYVEVEHQEFLLLSAGDVDVNHVGSKVYFSAENKVSISHDTNKRPKAGTVTQVNADGKVWVLPEVK